MFCQFKTIINYRAFIKGMDFTPNSQIYCSFFVYLESIKKSEKTGNLESLEICSCNLDDCCHQCRLFNIDTQYSNLGAIRQKFISACTYVVYNDGCLQYGVLF